VRRKRLRSASQNQPNNYQVETPKAEDSIKNKNQTTTKGIEFDLPQKQKQKCAEEEEPTSLSSSSASTSKPAPVSVPEEHSHNELQRTQTESEGDNTCSVCMDKPIDTAILECGHVCVCHSCGEALTTCPICRQPIARIVKIFKV